MAGEAKMFIADIEDAQGYTKKLASVVEEFSENVTTFVMDTGMLKDLGNNIGALCDVVGQVKALMEEATVLTKTAVLQMNEFVQGTEAISSLELKLELD